MYQDRIYAVSKITSARALSTAVRVSKRQNHFSVQKAPIKNLMSTNEEIDAAEIERWIEVAKETLDKSDFRPRRKFEFFFVGEGGFVLIFLSHPIFS